MVRDLEESQERYNGYAYIRTMRNILVGKKDACIAPYFIEKQYYGLVSKLKLEELENIMDRLVVNGELDVIYTEHGKLFCTHEYHEEMCKKKY